MTIERRKNIENKIKKGVNSLKEAVEVLKIHESTFPALGSVSNNGIVQDLFIHPSKEEYFFPAGTKFHLLFTGVGKNLILIKF